MLRQTKIDELVIELAQIRGSDLHLKVGVPPAIRGHGLLEYIGGYEVLRPVDTEDMLKGIIPEKLVEEFEEDREAYFSCAVQDVGYFRIKAFRQRGSVSIVMRFIQFGVPKFEDLNLPEVIGRRRVRSVASSSSCGRRAAANRLRWHSCRREEHHQPTRGWAGYG